MAPQWPATSRPASGAAPPGPGPSPGAPSEAVLDIFALVRRRTLDALAGLAAAGALPQGLDLGRFSVAPPRIGAPGDATVDAGLIYAPQAGGGLAGPAFAGALADQLRAAPEVAAVALVGQGLLVVALRAEVFARAVAAVLRGGAPDVCAAASERPGPARRSAAGPTCGPSSLAERRARVLAEILSSLSAAAGMPPPTRDGSAGGGEGRLPPVVLSGWPPGAGQGSDVGAGGAEAVLSWIGEDAFRFAVAAARRGAALHLDAAALGDRSRADPAFWIPYAHARARGVLKRAAAAMPDLDLCPAALAAGDFESLADEGELALMRLVAGHARAVVGAAEAGAPHRLVAQLRDLADALHSQWNRSKHQPQLRFVNEKQRELTISRLGLVTACALVLRSGLDVLGVAAPDEMR